MMMRESEFVSSQVFPNGCALLTLNRPERLNAVDYHMLLSLFDLLWGWIKIESVRFVVIRSSSPTAFSCGGDIPLVAGSAVGKASFTLAEYTWVQYRLMLLLLHYPKPVMALASGVCVGTGAGLAVNSAFTLSCPDSTRFAMPETRIRLIPDVLMSLHLSQCGGGMGVYLGMTGSMIGGSLMRDLGLAQCSLHSSLLPRLLNILTVDRSLMDGLSYSTGYDRSEFTRRMQELCQSLSTESTGSFTLSESRSDILLRSDPIRSLIQECFSLDKPAVFAYQRLSHLINSDQIEESTLEWANHTLNSLKRCSIIAVSLIHRMFQRIHNDLKFRSLPDKSEIISQWQFGCIIRQFAPCFFDIRILDNVFGHLSVSEMQQRHYQRDGINEENAYGMLDPHWLDLWFDLPSNVFISHCKSERKWIIHDKHPNPLIPQRLQTCDIMFECGILSGLQSQSKL